MKLVACLDRSKYDSSEFKRQGDKLLVVLRLQDKSWSYLVTEEKLPEVVCRDYETRITMPIIDRVRTAQTPRPNEIPAVEEM
jgi:hypothetical protein